jgi:hypothetical protein
MIHYLTGINLFPHSYHSLLILNFPINWPNDSWLVVWNIFYLPFHMWDVILPIDELIVFKMVKTTNQDSNSSVSGGAALAVGPGGLDRHAAGELCLVAARCLSSGREAAVTWEA